MVDIKVTLLLVAAQHPKLKNHYYLCVLNGCQLLMRNYDAPIFVTGDGCHKGKRAIRVQIIQVGFTRVPSMQFKYPLVLGKQVHIILSQRHSHCILAYTRRWIHPLQQDMILQCIQSSL
jgi:hypothetical protein